MPYPLANRLSSTLFSALLALTVNTQADQDPAMEIIIDDGSSSGESIEGADIVIEGVDPAQDREITIDAGPGRHLLMVSDDSAAVVGQGDFQT